MAESVLHFIELGWSEAKCGGVQVRPDGGLDIPHDDRRGSSSIR